MVHFRAADQLTKEYYEAEFDRVLIFDGTTYGAIREAATARTAYNTLNYTDPAFNDDYLAGLPDTVTEMAVNTRYIASFVNLLDDYVEISFDQGTTKDPEVIAARQEMARQLITDIHIANQVYEEVRQTNFDAYPRTI